MHFASVFEADANNMNMHEQIFRGLGEFTCDILDSKIGMDEVKYTLKKLKNRKSGGNDGILNEFWKKMANNEDV